MSFSSDLEFSERQICIARYKRVPMTGHKTCSLAAPIMQANQPAWKNTKFQNLAIDQT
jgi:hypothetical protein